MVLKIVLRISQNGSEYTCEEWFQALLNAAADTGLSDGYQRDYPCYEQGGSQRGLARPLSFQYLLLPILHIGVA